MNVSEPQVDSLLRGLQRVVERSPVHLRPGRRQIMRGMRAALSAVADGVSLDGLRDELLYELTGQAPEQPVVVRMGTPDPLPPLYQQILERLEAGWSTARICRELDCGKNTVTHCRRLRTQHCRQET